MIRLALSAWYVLAVASTVFGADAVGTTGHHAIKNNLRRGLANIDCAAVRCANPVWVCAELDAARKPFVTLPA